MLYIILGILFIFQQTAKVDSFKNQPEDSYKHNSVSAGSLFETTGNCEIQDDEQEANTDSDDVSTINTYYKHFFEAYVITKNISSQISPNHIISPLLLDIPPPHFC